MKTCDGCGTEFADDVELFPRLVFTREVQVARKLAERKGEEMLCLNCFLASIEDMEKKHLAMALLGLLRKIRSLEKNSGFDGYRKLQEVIEKSAPVNPYPQPQPYPNPIWIGTDSDDSVFSPPPWGTTQRTYGVQATVPASKTYSAESVYLTGTWGKLMSQK
jgi:hypothetical protein